MTADYYLLKTFAAFFNLEHLIKKTTCFKGSPSCVDLSIANRVVSLKSKILKALPKRKLCSY